jgi:hypothetical protein
MRIKEDNMIINILEAHRLAEGTGLIKTLLTNLTTKFIKIKAELITNLILKVQQEKEKEKT